MNGWPPTIRSGEDSAEIRVTLASQWRSIANATNAENDYDPG